MGRRGPAPDPVPLKVLKGRGNGKDSMGRPIPDVPKFNRGAPDAPEWLSDEAAALWGRTAPELERLDLLKPEDCEVFAAYCETWATYVAAIREVRAEGITVFNPKTQHAHKNPALGAAEVAGAQLLRYAQEFGLTPVAELNLGKTAKPDDGNENDPYTGQGDQAAS